jgi:hypothetical protein
MEKHKKRDSRSANLDPGLREKSGLEKVPTGTSLENKVG